MGCPLQPEEKQLLLEANDLQGRAERLQTILEMAIHVITLIRHGIDGERILGQLKLIDPKLLEILVCPKTKGALEFDSRATGTNKSKS